MPTMRVALVSRYSPVPSARSAACATRRSRANGATERGLVGLSPRGLHLCDCQPGGGRRVAVAALSDVPDERRTQ
eukprot:6953441-Prymnesium_polylepis.2